MPALVPEEFFRSGGAHSVRALEARSLASLPTGLITALAVLFVLIIILACVFLAYRLGAPGFGRFRYAQRERHARKTREARRDVLGADLDAKLDDSPASTRPPSPTNPLIPRPFPPPLPTQVTPHRSEIALVYAPRRSGDDVDIPLGTAPISQFELREAPRPARLPAPILRKEKERPLPIPKTPPGTSTGSNVSR